MAAKIKRNDQVQVLTGKDRGRRGEVRQVLGDENRAIVTGVNMIKKHQRSGGPERPGGIDATHRQRLSGCEGRATMTA